VKRDVFARAEAAMRPDAILATNTSYLDVNALQAACAHPERVIGLHFFSPAHVMKLLEIAWARRKRLAPSREAGERYVEIGDMMCELGWFELRAR